MIVRFCVTVAAVLLSGRGCSEAGMLKGREYYFKGVGTRLQASC